MATNYDKIANIYDLLSRIVFGKYIVKAQVCMLKYVPEDSRILLVGGGTGWILEELSKQHGSGLIIDYVESSEKMIALSQKRNYGNNAVNFIPLAIENFTGMHKYDVVFTPFVFDNFKPDKTTLVFNKLNAQLKAGGIWLYADFVYDENAGRFWQKILLKIMYLFFTITCNIETNDIENMDPYFSAGYKKIFENRLYARFIKADVYQKSGD